MIDPADTTPEEFDRKRLARGEQMIEQQEKLAREWREQKAILRLKQYAADCRIPVIPVGHPAAFESIAQAARMCRCGGSSIIRALAEKSLVRGRPWLKAGKVLLAALIAGGWAEADRQGLVPFTMRWALILGPVKFRARLKPQKVSDGQQHRELVKEVA